MLLRKYIPLLFTVAFLPQENENKDISSRKQNVRHLEGNCCRMSLRRTVTILEIGQHLLESEN